jgi:poly(ADP-ribose) glycohydrolase ARH3
LLALTYNANYRNVYCTVAHITNYFIPFVNFFIIIINRFVKEYFKEPRRGYGGNVAHVFKKLQDSNFVDVFAPASEQFGGMGSFGNGGAMRVAPVALYYHGHKDGQQAMLDAALRATSITHTHRDACNGAILQVCLISFISMMDN